MLLESIKFALEALGRNAMRSALTALGVLIGVGAVITMVTIGEGASAKVRGEISKLGSNLLVLKSGQQMRGGSGISIHAAPFDYADIQALQNEVRGLRYVAPYSSRPLLAVARNVNWKATIAGTENGYFLAHDWKAAKGRLFTDQETYNGRPVCIIGETVRKRLFGAKDGVGEALRFGSVPCTVIGTLAPRGLSGANGEDDNLVALPFDAYQRRVQGKPDIDAIYMAAFPGTDTERLTSKIAGLMRERRGLGAGQAEDFSILDMRQVADSMAATAETLTLFLGAIAAVSLLVGGIGIMNIMLVSVTERSREIGVRLAIGALPSQVKLQFLVEAVVLTMIGGFAGIVGGIAAAALIVPAFELPLVIDPAIVALSLAVSVAIGVGFGYLPAARAARLDPIEALRRE